MESMPVEIVELFLATPKLNLEDVLNFSVTCKHFHEVVQNSSYVWKKKFKSKWPQFMRLFNDHFNDWYTEIRYIYELSSRTHAILSTMLPRFYRRNEFSDCDLEEWTVLIEETPRSYEYVVLDLMTILNTCAPINSIQVVPVDTPGNKTLQYYAGKVLRFVRQMKLTWEWQEFVALPPQKQILEKGATFVAQWCQSTLDIRWEDIALQLDSFSEEVKIQLRFTHPDHPLHKVPEGTLTKWKLENLESNQWNVNECRQLIQCLTLVLYEHNQFRGNNIAYYMPENSFINEVLSRREGLPITLAIVYESVARRLGLKCEPISFPAHFLLRFTEGRGESRADSYYIDVFNNGHIIRKGACPHTRTHTEPNNHLMPASAKQVVERMANNLEVSCRQHRPNESISRLRSILELLHVINPQDVAAVVNLARVYMLHNIDAKPLENHLLTHEFDAPEQVQRIVQMLRDYDLHRKHNYLEPPMPASILCPAEIDLQLWSKEFQTKPKSRPENLTFAVGMVMKHLSLNYTCVIYDWDPTCNAPIDWQAQMGVHKLKFNADQPFYNVLVEDGSHRYVAQENIVTTKHTGFLYLNNVGRHFSHFFGTHYVPNAEKEKEFPDDAAVRHSFHHKILLGLL